MGADFERWSLLIKRYPGAGGDGVDGPSLQIGCLRLTRANVDDLVEDLIAWCDEVDLDEVKRPVIASTRPCPKCGGTAVSAELVPAWKCTACGCLFQPRPAEPAGGDG